ncbi:hypothetical protein PPYR_05689 [Photinus pyralis]|uniref:PHD-type domain-containing protein n=1 Tax=Photinus pyralis TaxID=7054 RepID=A0A5N4AVD6_PHOPY|nr:hypothetical protein PPYR_05689 [Photinus pyralis]
MKNVRNSWCVDVLFCAPIISLLIFNNMPTINKCFICNNALDSDREIKCDKCGNHIHSTCAGLSQSELKCFSNKNRKLAYHCDECNKENSEISEIKQLILSLKAEIDELKSARSLEYI